MSSLPQEVLDEIVRHVDTDVEPESLFQPFPSHRNLALAARCFVHSSYSRIYEKVKFRHESQTSFGRPRTTPTYRKRINFETHPRLIRYIRHVEVSAAFAFPRCKSNEESHRSFASITERLSKVTRVQLHSSRVVDWDDVAPTYQDSIRRLASTNPVSELLISNITNIPLAAAVSLSSLRSITVLQQGSVSSSCLNLQVQDLRLATYTHRSSNTVALGTLFNLQLPALYVSLVTLDLCISSTEIHKDAWSTVLSHGCHPATLKTLRLAYCKPSCRASADHFVQIVCQDIISTRRSLPSFPHLRSLSLSFLAEEGISEHLSNIPLPSFLPRSLSQLFAYNSQPSLEALQILMRWHPTVGPPALPWSLNEETIIESQGGEWQELDQVLSDDQKFPRICATRLETQYRFNNPILFEPLYGEIGNKLVEEDKALLRTQMLDALPRTARRTSELVVEVCVGRE